MSRRLGMRELDVLDALQRLPNGGHGPDDLWPLLPAYSRERLGRPSALRPVLVRMERRLLIAAVGEGRYAGRSFAEPWRPSPWLRR